MCACYFFLLFSMTSISPFHVKPTTQKEMTLADSFASLVKQYDKNIRPNYTGKCHTIRYWYRHFFYRMVT